MAGSPGRLNDVSVAGSHSRLITICCSQGTQKNSLRLMIFTYCSKALLLLWTHLAICVLCMSVILSYLFLATFWSRAGKERVDPLALVCDAFFSFCHFQIWCPGSGVLFDCIDS